MRQSRWDCVLTMALLPWPSLISAMSDYLAGPGWAVLALILASPAAPVARLGAVDVHVVRVPNNHSLQNLHSKNRKEIMLVLRARHHLSTD